MSAIVRNSGWLRMNSPTPRGLFQFPFFCYIEITMNEEKKKAGLFQIVCPCCQSVLWVDGMTEAIVKTEKRAAKKKDSLDELLSKEKKRVSEFERKFEVTAELEKKKLEKAEEKFAKAMGEAEKEE